MHLASEADTNFNIVKTIATHIDSISNDLPSNEEKISSEMSEILAQVIF